MKKRNRLGSVLLCLVLLCLMCTSCGNALSNDNKGAVENGYAAVGEDSSVTGMSDNAPADSSRKIIEYVTMNVQTKSFDSLLSGLQKQLKTCGGYVESSHVSGNSDDATGDRMADLVLRIPADKADVFSTYLAGNSTVTSKDISTKDVTLDYVDTESRLTALKSEKDALQRLLEKATSVADIVSIQDKLTDVIAKIESCQTQLRTYDNLISYTTFTISVVEVEQTDIVGKQTVWQEIGTNLNNNMRDIRNFFVRLFVWFVSVLPTLAILAVIVVIVLLIVRKTRRTHQKKNPPQAVKMTAPLDPTPPQNQK